MDVRNHLYQDVMLLHTLIIHSLDRHSNEEKGHLHEKGICLMKLPYQHKGDLTAEVPLQVLILGLF